MYVDDTTDRLAVVCVRDTVMAQFEVFSVAAISTLLTTVLLAVADINTAVAVSNGTSMRCHAVPSFAMAQSVAEAGAGIGKNRLTRSPCSA